MMPTVKLLRQAGDFAIFSCPPDTSIAAGAAIAGYRVHIQCGVGGCGACRAKLFSGQVEYRRAVSKSKTHDAVSGERQWELLCQAMPVTDVVLQPALGWSERKTRPLSSLLEQPNEVEATKSDR